MRRVVSRVFTIARDIAILVSVAIVVYVGVTSRQSAVIALPSLSELPTSRSPTSVAPSEDIADQKLHIDIDEVPLGARGQRWAIVEFADFQCPSCGMYARNTFPSVKRLYIDTGQVEYLFRHFPLVRTHTQATAAAEAAECARRAGQFLSMHERLFFHQQELDPAALRRHAAAVGLPLREFEACTAGAASQRVLDDRALGVRLGVKGTPTFLIGRIEGRRIYILRAIRGAAPLAAFQLTFNALEGSRQR